MTDKEYNDLCAALFAELEEMLEAAGRDYDNNGNVLEVYGDEDDEDAIVINKQPAMREVWLAARSGGRHFRHINGEWQDTRGGETLPQQLRALLQ